MKDAKEYISVTLLAILVTLMLFVSAEVSNVSREQIKAGKEIASMASDIRWLKGARAGESIVANK